MLISCGKGKVATNVFGMFENRLHRCRPTAHNGVSGTVVCPPISVLVFSPIGHDIGFRNRRHNHVPGTIDVTALRDKTIRLHPQIRFSLLSIWTGLYTL